VLRYNRIGINDSLFSTALLKLCFIMIIWSYYFGGLLNFRYFELIPLLTCALISLIYLIVYFLRGTLEVESKYLYLFSLIFTHLFLVIVFSLFNNSELFYFPSVFYESYKLYLFLFFFSFILVSKEVNWVFFFYKVVSFFMVANLFVLIAQHIFGVSFVNLIGVKYDVSFYNLRGRPTGLTLNANVIGSLSLSFYIFLHYLKEAVKRGYKYASKINLNWLSIMQLITFICVVLSSSKASLLCLVFFYFLNTVNLKNATYIIISFFLSMFLIYYLNIYDIQIKLESYLGYSGWFNDNIDIRFVEGRVFYWYHAVNIFSDNIFGLGFGTWGDFSSSFNPASITIPSYNDSSDSALSHYLVEQGVFTILYLFILLFTLKSKNVNVTFYWLILVILFFSNSGFSQPMFYIGFWINALQFHYYRTKQ